MAAPSRSAAPTTGGPSGTRFGLRIVGPPGDRNRLRILVAVIAIGAMFLIVAAQTFVVAQQRHIDQVNRAIAAETTRAEQLRLELAERQSPQRITAEASLRLGMIPAPTPIYLQPRADDDARAAELPPTTPITAAPRAATPTTPTTAAPKAPTTTMPKAPTTTVKR